ncbi:MAG: hypothetical protein AAGL90_15630 [Pseudomonadota bacterium]
MLTLTEALEKLEATASLASDFAVLQAEARSQVRSLSALRAKTQAAIEDLREADHGGPKDVSRTQALVLLSQQISVWEARIAVYGQYRRLVAQKRSQLGEAH